MAEFYAELIINGGKKTMKKLAAIMGESWSLD
jgi:hypothetical protein